MSSELSQLEENQLLDPEEGYAPRHPAHLRLFVSSVARAKDAVLITEAIPLDAPGPRIVYANPAFERMTGYTCDEMMGRTPRVLQGPTSDRAALDRIREALQAGQPVREQITNCRKDGTEFRVDLSIFPLADEIGRQTHWIAIQREVTGGYALEQSEKRYRMLAEALPQMVWATSADGVKTFCNQHYLDYLGVETMAQVDGNWLSCIHPEEREYVSSVWRRSIATGEPYNCEYRIRRKDGVYRYVLARASLVHNSDETVQGWIGTSTDIHDRKIADAAMRKAEKLASAGRLAASIAHQINNPLAGAINSLYLMSLDPNLSESSRVLLLQAESELARVAQVTTQTLGFFRQSTAPALVDIGKVLDSALLLHHRRLQSQSIAAHKRYGSCSPLFCRGEELRQVFANLISNSLDSMPFSGRLLLRIRDGHLWDDSRTPGIRVTIADTGHGVPPDLRDRIFDPFVSTRDATGTGLGLWVVKDLVEKHRGMVCLRSSTAADRHGTVVSLFFPYGAFTA